MRRATGMTPLRRLAIVLRDDVCHAIGVAVTQLLGHPVVWMRMAAMFRGIRWGIGRVDGPLLALTQKAAVKKNGCSRGKGGPSGCTCRTCRALGVSTWALLELGLLQMKMRSAANRCLLRMVECWELAAHRP